MRRINCLALASAAALLAAQSQQAIANNDVRLVKSKEPTATPFWLSKGKQAAQWKQEKNRRPRG
jgi:hypothetical protein